MEMLSAFGVEEGYRKNILNATLGETIRAVDGLEQAIEKRLEEARRLAEEKSKTRTYTYGELRGNPALAQALCFVDKRERDSEDVAFEVRASSAENFKECDIVVSNLDRVQFLVEAKAGNANLRWPALFGGNPAMTENDIDDLKGLNKGKVEGSLP